MEALSYDTQIDALVEKGHLDEAISLLDMLEDALLKDKPSRLREIKLEKAQNLFRARKYRDAVDLFGARAPIGCAGGVLVFQRRRGGHIAGLCHSSR